MLAHNTHTLLIVSVTPLFTLFCSDIIFVLFLLYARTFPVIAQAEVKTILKSSGERYKRLRAEGKPLYSISKDGVVRETIIEADEKDSPALGGAQIVLNSDK